MTENYIQSPQQEDDLGERLLAACKDGKIKDVTRLLQMGCNPNYSSAQNRIDQQIPTTPILAAATYPISGDGTRKMMFKQAGRIIDELLKAGGRLGDVAIPYLDVVSGSGNIDGVNLAAEQGVDVHKLGYVCMASAMRSADDAMISHLVGMGIPINIRDKWLSTPFMNICAGNITFRRDEKLSSRKKIPWLVAKISCLKASGVDLDEKDSVGATPLIRAISTENWAVAEALILCGADSDVKLRNGVGATHLITRYGSRDFICFYLKQKKPFADLEHMKLLKIQPDIRSIIATFLRTTAQA